MQSSILYLVTIVSSNIKKKQCRRLLMNQLLKGDNLDFHFWLVTDMSLTELFLKPSIVSALLGLVTAKSKARMNFRCNPLVSSFMRLRWRS